MAKATVKETVTKKIRLTLSEEEAIVLQAILLKVGGDPSDSPRKYADSIRWAMRDTLNDAVVADRLAQRSSGHIILNDGKVQIG